MEYANKYEETIVGKYRKTIWSKFLKGIKEYELIKEGDKIAVCISGGKDSMLMAKCMQRLQRYSKVPFEVVFLVMNPGYNEINRQKIVDNAELLGIPIEMFETRIFDAVAKVDEHPCYLCARMRRGYLYKQAQDMGCNKIALGHHFDDVIETILMGMLYGSQMQTMMPKLHSENYGGMQLIRPMYLVKEADIISWKQYNDLQFIQCACRFTENCTMCDNGGGGSKRQEIKALIKELRQVNPAVDMNIFRSAQNVNLKTLISYHIGDEYHSFLDNYEDGVNIKGKRTEVQ
jgi:tRNA(Ile)-lysidine synthase TilS/MesJ